MEIEDNFTPSKCVEIWLLSLMEEVSDKLHMFMPCAVMPPLTAKVRNIFLNQIVQYQLLPLSCSVLLYKHTLPKRVPASSDFCEGNSSQVYL